MASKALKGKKVAIVSTDLPDQVDVIQRALVDPLKKAGVNVVVYDVMPCQGNIVCTQPIPQSVMKVADAKPDVVLPILTATTLPAYVNEMKRAGMKAKLYESSYNALGTDLVQSKVLQVGGKEVADYYKGATVVSATVAGDWRLPGFGPPPIGVMCNDTYAANTTTGDTFAADTDGYPKWGMVGLVVHQHADGGPGDVRRRRRTSPSRRSSTRSERCRPTRSAGSVARPSSSTSTRRPRRPPRSRARATYPCKLPAPPEDTICLIPVSTKGRTVKP